MRIYRFEESVAWQKGQELATEIYRLFRDHKDYGFRDQITRAAVSVSNNIAEGFDRDTEQELRHFLYISRGSCAEVRSMVYLAEKLNYIDQRQAEKLHEIAMGTSRLISSFIKKARK